MWTNMFEYKKYPAQMLKVAGDLWRASGAFENPVNTYKRLHSKVLDVVGIIKQAALTYSVC